MVMWLIIEKNVDYFLNNIFNSYVLDNNYYIIDVKFR